LQEPKIEFEDTLLDSKKGIDLEMSTVTMELILMQVVNKNDSRGQA